MDKAVFVHNVQALCDRKGIKPTNACIESGVGRSFLANIRRCKTPSVSKVQMLAEYLGVTSSELLGEQSTRIFCYHNVPPQDSIDELFQVAEVMAVEIVRTCKREHFDTLTAPIDPSEHAVELSIKVLYDESYTIRSVPNAANQQEITELLLKLDALDISLDMLVGKDTYSSTEEQQSARLLSDIYNSAKELSEEKQDYILDMIRTFQKHRENIVESKTNKPDSIVASRAQRYTPLCFSRVGVYTQAPMHAPCWGGFAPSGS